jgi:hypothetical protein
MWRHSGEDLEDRSAVPAAAHRDDGLALLGSRTFINDQLKGPISFVTGARK